MKNTLIAQSGEIMITIGAIIAAFLGVITLGRKAYGAYASDNTGRIKHMSDTIKSMQKQMEHDAKDHHDQLTAVHNRVDELYKLLVQQRNK